jgi:hypothetical protein
MATLRQYASVIEVQDIAGITGVTDKMIEAAEADIDKVVADFYNPPFCKSTTIKKDVTADQIIFSGNTLTLIGQSFSTNYLQYCIVEIMEGVTKGRKYPIISSNNNTITLDEDPGLTTSVGVRIYQLGKFPMYKDMQTFKSIPSEIVEAVSWQVAYNKGNKKINKGAKKSESIGTNYSYTNVDAKDDTIANRTAPKSMDILSALGFTIQSSM